MHLVVIGVNHKTAPVEIRERLSIPNDRFADALTALRSCEGVLECAILSTCNRSEFYAYTSSKAYDQGIVDCVCAFCGIPQAEIAGHLYSIAGHKAAEHLFRVSAGLDSMVVGEAQILGQVKGAYAEAVSAGSTGAVLNTLLQQAITVGKRARTETEIGRGAFSIGSVAIQLAKSIFGTLSARAVLVIGAGEMSELAITHLVSSGADRIVVTNRTYGKAVELASRFGGSPARFDDLPSALVNTDIVISSTGANAPIITRSMVSSVMRTRRGRPMFMIDIAVPRDIEPGVSDIDNVFAYDIDDLQSAVRSDAEARKSEMRKVDSIIADEVQSFKEWFRALDAVPVITALREKLEGIRQAEVDKLRSKRPHLSREDLEAIDVATKSIVNRICHQPMHQIKEYATGDDASANLETICDVFGICPVDYNGKEDPRSDGND